MKTQKAIYYKNWQGEWVKSSLPSSKKYLKYVQKKLALNGQASIHIVASKNK